MAEALSSASTVELTQNSKIEDRVSVAPNWKLVWWRFRKNKLAVIRVNAINSIFFDEDLQASVRARPDAIRLPKVETAEELRQADALRSGGDLASAYDTLAPLLAERPNDPDVVGVLARMYGWQRAMRIFDGPDEVHLRTIARTELGREKSPLAAAVVPK